MDELKKRRKSNRLRLYKIANAAREAKKLHTEIDDYLISSACDDLHNDNMMHLINLRSSLQQCANNSLFREYQTNGALEYIASQTCKHKLCPVCNKERQRVVRSKYYNFFKGGVMHLPSYESKTVTDENGNTVYKTFPEYGPTGRMIKKGVPKRIKTLTGYQDLPTKDYSFFHLTLTVPHNEEGWRGKKFYAKELMKEFNFLRKKKFWKESVFGGEFGVEVTKGANGMHVHIHALVIAYKIDKNRNNLYRNILKHWNMQTATADASRVEFTEADREGIAKALGNKKGYGSANETDKLFIESLDPTGATMISLESLYILSKKKKSSFDRWMPDVQKWKHYVNPEDPESFLSGIMECIKYHFEPIGLKKHAVKLTKTKGVQEIATTDDEGLTIYDYAVLENLKREEYDGIYNFDLINEVLPEIYKQPLYRKFGALHGVDCLNINPTCEDELNEVLENYGREETVNPETLNPDENVKYLVARATAVFVDKEKDYKPTLSEKAKVSYLASDKLVSAMLEMINNQIKEVISRKRKRERVNEMDKEFSENRQNYELLKWSLMQPSEDFE
jgi:hypothetical protein